MSRLNRTRSKVLLSSAIVLLVSASVVANCPEGGHWAEWPTVEVPRESSPVETLSLDILWSLDCGADAEQLIGRIVAVAPAASCKTLLLDGQLDQVLVVSPAGEILRVFGRAGEGPGDLPGSYRLFELHDGRIGVCGGAPAMTVQIGGTGKIVLLDRAAQPAGLWYGAGDPGSMPVVSIRELRCSNDHVLTSSNGMIIKQEGMSDKQELSIVDSVSGNRSIIDCREIVLDPSESQLKEESYFEPFANGRCDISSSGRVAYAPLRNRWLVVVRDIGGGGIVLDREWSPVRRTEEKKEAVWNALGGTDDCVAMDHEPAVGRIRWRPDGKLWVEPLGINPGDGAIVCFDEFSHSGELLRRVQVEIPNASGDDELKILEDGRFAVLRGFGSSTDGIGSVTPQVLLAVIERHADSD